MALCLVLDDYAPGSHDVGDPSTTNLYLGNINPQVILEKYNECWIICFYTFLKKTVLSISKTKKIQESDVSKLDRTTVFKVILLVWAELSCYSY